MTVIFTVGLSLRLRSQPRRSRPLPTTSPQPFAFNCAYCGAPVTAPSYAATVKCSYCGQTNVVPNANSLTPPGMQWNKAYVTRTEGRLQGEGYSTQRDVVIPSIPFKVDLIATKTSSEASKFGLFTRTFALSCASDPTPESVKEFSSLAADFCVSAARKSQVRAPGAQGDRGTLVVTALVADAAGKEVKEWVDANQPEKRWKAFDFRVLVSGDDGKLHYCRKTPIWGAAYYGGLSDYVDRMLTI